MIARKIFQELKKISDIPLENRTDWLVSAVDGINFLRSNASTDYTVIDASMPNAHIKAALVPQHQVNPPDVDDLLNAHSIGSETWCIQRSYGGGEPHRVYLEPPLSHTGCNSLVGGEPLVFHRTFHGMKEHRTQVEISQRMIHALDLHFLEERNAYCRLDNNGDIEDVVCIFQERSEVLFQSKSAVLIATADLHRYMALSNQALFRKFDFTRVAPDSFSGWGDHGRSTVREPTLFYRGGMLLGRGSYVNGGEIVFPNTTVDAIVEEWVRSMGRLDRKYETFKIVDWKNERQVECSCAPDAISNYFTKSDKPFEVSPAFFRPEVLHKYKADPEKYDLKDRSISCRNAWSLKTYDINDAGQVHTYIVYLADLPYEEQQYWKLYNEWPKESISRRAYENDILGEFSTERDPLQGLRSTISEWDRAKPIWWKIRGNELADRVLYPAGNAAKEWADEILALDQLIVEGFITTELRKIVNQLGASAEKDWQSLKLLEVLVCALGAPEEEAKALLDPLRELHHLRSKLRGHATPEARALERAAISRHSTYREHFRALCARCDGSLLRLAQSLSQLVSPA